MQAQIGLSSTMSYELREALLVYQSDRQNSTIDSRAVASTFITKHSVQVSSAGIPALGPGAVLDKSDLDSLIKGLQGSVPVEFLPTNVLVRTHDSIVWWTPPAIRPMFYSKDKSDDLDLLSGKKFPQPALLFRAASGRFAVRALKSNERPSLKSTLYRAPYWNVYDTGDVCLGSTKVPHESTVQSMAKWEHAFFESEFTHANATGKLTEHPGGFIGLWKSLVGKKTFPTEYLANAKETLEQFIKA